MKYQLHNPDIVENRKDKARLHARLDDMSARLGTLLQDDSPEPVLHVYLDQIEGGEYLVYFIIRLDSGVVFSKERSSEILAMLDKLFERTKYKLKRKIRNQRQAYLQKKKEKEKSELKEHRQELEELRKPETRQSFNELVNILLGDVTRYMRQRLRSARMTTAIGQEDISLNDLLGELYLMIYERMDEMPADERQSRLWMYQLADELIDKHTGEGGFEEQKLNHLPDIVEDNYKDMQEDFTVDADQELTLVEELENHLEPKDQYNLYDLLYEEDEETMLDEIALQYNREEINSIIEKELAKLPVFKRTIMDLYLLSQMNIHEIAQIKGVSKEKVDEVITEVSQELRTRLISMA